MNDGDLSKISKIRDHIYVSGIFPLEENPKIIKQLNIKYIICCVDPDYVSEVHDKIMLNNRLTIICLPYLDNPQQNLWQSNNNSVRIMKYVNNMDEYQKISDLYKKYNKKPLIEIGYHFLNMAVQEKANVLIHCMAGISRSVSLVIYYLMKHDHYDFQKAYQQVYSNRNIANPNKGFRKQLQGYQNKRACFSEHDAKIIIENSL